MHRDRKELGRAGEQIALELLKKSRYKILQTNYTTRLGEVDIIALDRSTIVFIEVKSIDARSSLFNPLEHITRSKQHRLRRLALLYLKQHKLDPETQKIRFDVVSVIFNDTDKPEVTLIRNGF